MQSDKSLKPFFSIGVTTYDRVGLLKETLLSILNQTYKNYEVIVGNDNPKRTISEETLGINDPRIRFINHRKNLGEHDNMNFLLSASKGKYFTWLFDDDMYALTFLESVYNALMKFGPKAPVFTTYLMDSDFKGRDIRPVAKASIFTGKQFLRMYLNHSVKTQGCFGVFNIDYLRQTGGWEQLGAHTYSVYADNLLAIRSGLLEEVVFINDPLILYRAHKESVSLIISDLDMYSNAQKDLCRKFIQLFSVDGDKIGFRYNLFLLLKWCVGDFAVVSLRSGSFPSRKQLAAYLIFLNACMAPMRGSVLYFRMIAYLIKITLRFLRDFTLVKFKLKKSALV